MKVRLIIVQDDHSDGPWVHGAWDEYAMDENDRGYREELEKARENGEVRLVDVSLPRTLIDALFSPVKIHAPGIEIVDLQDQQ
jgi:hypothetical protein